MWIIVRRMQVNVGRRKFPLFLEHSGSNWISNVLLENEAFVDYLNTNTSRNEEHGEERPTTWALVA